MIIRRSSLQSSSPISRKKPAAKARNSDKTVPKNQSRKRPASTNSEDVTPMAKKVKKSGKQVEIKTHPLTNSIADYIKDASEKREKIAEKFEQNLQSMSQSLSKSDVENMIKMG
ncbi:hypothetical protein EAF04_009916 [Stromatinia cepivora]|nr:hypothetical protein EAF04_009916 [Stromatinia cepivora]